MNIKKITNNNTEIAIVKSDAVCISDVQSALDFMMSVNYETGKDFIYESNHGKDIFFVSSEEEAIKKLDKA